MGQSYINTLEYGACIPFSLVTFYLLDLFNIIWHAQPKAMLLTGSCNCNAFNVTLTGLDLNAKTTIACHCSECVKQGGGCASFYIRQFLSVYWPEYALYQMACTSMLFLNIVSKLPSIPPCSQGSTCKHQHCPVDLWSGFSVPYVAGKWFPLLFLSLQNEQTSAFSSPFRGNTHHLKHF